MQFHIERVRVTCVDGIVQSCVTAFILSVNFNYFILPTKFQEYFKTMNETIFVNRHSLGNFMQSCLFALFAVGDIDLNGLLIT